MLCLHSLLRCSQTPSRVMYVQACCISCRIGTGMSAVERHEWELSSWKDHSAACLAAADAGLPCGIKYADMV